MKRERRKQYPKNWELLARQCKQHAGWRCSKCRIRHGAKRTSKRTRRTYIVYLHAAHVRLHDTDNPQPELLALCPTCHGRMDWRNRQREQCTNVERMKHHLILTQVGL